MEKNVWDANSDIFLLSCEMNMETHKTSAFALGLVMPYEQCKNESQNPLLLQPVKPPNICGLFVLNETASSRKKVNISEGH